LRKKTLEGGLLVEENPTVVAKWREKGKWQVRVRKWSLPERKRMIQTGPAWSYLGRKQRGEAGQSKSVSRLTMPIDF